MLARAQHDLSAGDGDSFNSSTLNLLTHSIQSSLLTRRVAIHAFQNISQHQQALSTLIYSKTAVEMVRVRVCACC